MEQANRAPARRRGDEGGGMRAPYTIFGEMRLVPVKVYREGRLTNETDWDADLWVERGEDWYALGSGEYLEKRVRVIERDVWLRCQPADAGMKGEA